MDRENEIIPSSSDKTQAESLTNFPHCDNVSSYRLLGRCPSAEMYSQTEPNCGKSSSLKCEKLVGEVDKINDYDLSKDTSQLLPSENTKEKCRHVSNTFNNNPTGYSNTQLHRNVKVLYGFFVSLATIFVCSGLVCALHVRALRRDLDLMNDVLYQMRNDALSYREMSRISNLLKKLNVRAQSSHGPDKARFWAAVSGEEDIFVRQENRKESSDEHPNMRRRDKRHADDGAPKEWAWMSSYVRVPVSFVTIF
ncbi:hypothetical protein ElyMa_000732400 [Elysia marginata]|uniref:Uncharacterized protein n=1 Tax=Elysia marginata TaxID=1093978 RepID=A0AAV4GQM2_9GAST|nr:hypothetical protein ElyMa_000732400 [Elysia marginata]